jgi:glucose-6-phosphate 1-dehydrogenase
MQNTESQGQPPPKNPLRAGIADDKTGEPCAVVIFGASGDLTKRKLMPALYNLAVSRALPSGSAVVGVARREHSNEDFRRDMKEAITRFSRRKIDQAVWGDFERGVSYVKGTFEDPATYQSLKTEVERLDRERGTRGNRLFYLAVPPADFSVIVQQLQEAGLVADPRSSGGPWTRVVFEKPFGHDLKSALELNGAVGAVFDEKQVFRIDHYLGKETVQNLLVFRFANSLFEPLWNREHVDHVQITVAEEIGVEGRGKFYEQTGLTRDIVENHAMQLLCLTAMEPPISLAACATRR